MDHGCGCHGQRGLINVNISNHGRWLVAGGWWLTLKGTLQL